MNTVRIAALLRELADEIERGGARVAPNNPPPKVKLKRKQVRKPYVPTREISEFEMARAKGQLKKLGIPFDPGPGPGRKGSR